MKIIFIVAVFYVSSSEAKTNNTLKPQYAQSLGQHVPTEIIDLPDDPSGQQSLYNALGWTAWIPNNGNAQIDAKNTKAPTQIQIPIMTKTNGKMVTNHEQLWPKSFSNDNQRIVENGLSVSRDLQQYNPYLTQPYFYSPLYPSQYFRDSYPSLYQQFPNGFYILPDSSKINTVLTPTTNTRKQEPKVISNTERNQISLQQAFKNDGHSRPDQQTNVRTFNHTSIGEKKTFVSHIELKPVSTKFTRYNKPNGKSYVKIISTDQDGVEQVTEHEYTGNIDLKINNGLLETPKSKNTFKVNKEVQVDRPGVDPNSITVDRKEDEEPETGEPVDVDSWIN